MTDRIAEKMAQASATTTVNPPKKGERFRCEQCGMEIEVTADCQCKPGAHVQFECCGQQMAKV
jgi:hypothetical protein